MHEEEKQANVRKPKNEIKYWPQNLIRSLLMKFVCQNRRRFGNKNLLWSVNDRKDPF